VAGKALWLALSVVGIAAIAAVDYATGIEFRIFPLYYLPISLGAWHAGWPAAMVLAALSAGAWIVSNAIAGEQYGDPLVVAVNSLTLLVAAGSVGALVSVLRSRLDAEHDLGRRDSLTSLPNRRAFHERGEMLLAGARRYAHPITLAYLDLDSFKSVNDAHGHAEGDMALRAVGSVLRRQTRAADLVARLGGDEFAVLLVETDADAAAVLLERLRQLIDEAMRAGRWPITVTVGAVTFPTPPASLEALLRRADAALYAAKRAGKNRLLLEVVAPTETVAAGEDA
jgi:diguanylate cyclase (GGDEF)-like protein